MRQFPARQPRIEDYNNSNLIIISILMAIFPGELG